MDAANLYTGEFLHESSLLKSDAFSGFFARAVARLHHSMASCDEDFG
jgi:hypothetical protein